MPAGTMSRNVTDLAEEILNNLKTTDESGLVAVSALGCAVRELCAAMLEMEGKHTPIDAFAGGVATEEILDAALRHTNHAQLLCIYLATVLLAVNERARQQQHRGELAETQDASQGPLGPGIERQTP